MAQKSDTQYSRNYHSQVGAAGASGIVTGRIFGNGPIARSDEVLRVFTAIMRGEIDPWDPEGFVKPRSVLYCAIEAARALAKYYGLEQAPSENDKDIQQKAGQYNTMVERIMEDMTAAGQTATREEVIAKIAAYDPEIKSVLIQ